MASLTTQGGTSIHWILFSTIFVTECPSAGWRLQIKEGVHLQRGRSVSGQKACGVPGDLKSSPEHLSVVGALPEEAESLPTSGEMASPNFPRNYLNDLHKRKTIEVAKGNVINIHFTDYELEKPDHWSLGSVRNQKSKSKSKSHTQFELDRKFNSKTDLFSSFFLFEHSFRWKNAFENLGFPIIGPKKSCCKLYVWVSKPRRKIQEQWKKN